MKIAIGGSAANPPHLGHKQLVEAVVQMGEFDRVQWIISGNRPDKPHLMPVHMRHQMSKALFGDNCGAEIIAEHGDAVPTITVLDAMQERYPDAEITFFCGSDHFVCKDAFDGNCEVMGFWDEAPRLFATYRFLIFLRAGSDARNLQLPPKARLCRADIPQISSTDIRHRIRCGQSVVPLVGKDVAAVIDNNQLYMEERL